MNDSIAVTISLHTAGNKIREYSGENDARWVDILKALNLSAFSIGVTTSISSIEFSVIKAFLAREFKDFSSVEVVEAFQKYAAQKLSFTEKPYNNMNNLFISNVLIAYRKYRNEQLSKHIIEVKAVLPVAKINTDEENYFELVSYVEKNAKLPEWGSNIYLSAYAYFDKNVSIATVEDKKAFAEKVREKLIREQDFARLEGYTMTARAKVNEIENMINRPQTFANHCRVEYIKDYLTKKYLK
jgi:hypothetical protein